MATIRQIEANRLNAQKSTGPRSVAGKTASCQNALKSGIDAKSQIIRGEKAADLEALTDEYLAEYQPLTPTERCFVDILIRTDWQLRRLARAEAQLWKYELDSVLSLDPEFPLGQAFNRGDKTFEILQRRIAAAERSYKQALHELQLLQASRPSPPTEPAVLPLPQISETRPAPAPIGFVPSTPITPSPSDPQARQDDRYRMTFLRQVA